MVLGYWLPIWRWGHQEASPVEVLEPDVRVDPRTNAAFLAADGLRTVHDLDRPASATIQMAGARLCYAEGIDGFLQEAHGYDIRQFAATEIPTRDLGYEVSERFTLPLLLRCGLAGTSWRQCVRLRMEGRDAETLLGLFHSRRAQDELPLVGSAYTVPIE